MVRIASADLHFWEEPPLSGQGGAGAVFFCGCPLGCVYCQNYEISRGGVGHPVSVPELAAVFLRLEERGAQNLDLVTGTPYAAEIARAVGQARAAGLRLPVVWNSSGFETVETLKLLDGIIDVYLPDFKYWAEEDAARYSNAPGYRRQAKLALAEMIRQQPRYRLGQDGSLQAGVVVRHLVLPGADAAARRILRYLRDVFGPTLWVSLLRQYTPTPQAAVWPELRREVRAEEYARCVRTAAGLGFETLFIQEAGCSGLSFVPAFAL